MKIKKYIPPLVMLIVFEAVAVTLWLTLGNIFYLFNFSYIGISVSLGIFLYIKKYKHARRITQLADMGTDFLTQFQNEPPKVADYSKRLQDPMNAIYWKMTVEFGVMYIQMYLDWVNKCKKELEEIRDEQKKIHNTADNADNF